MCKSFAAFNKLGKKYFNNLGHIKFYKSQECIKSHFSEIQ